MTADASEPGGCLIAGNDTGDGDGLDPEVLRRVNAVALRLARIIGWRMACEDFAARMAIPQMITSRRPMMGLIPAPKHGALGLSLSTRTPMLDNITTYGHMTIERSISAADANRNFSSLLRAVRDDGASYLVTNYGKPVARLVPAGRHEAVAATARALLLQRLAKQSVVTVGGCSRNELYEDEA